MYKTSEFLIENVRRIFLKESKFIVANNLITRQVDVMMQNVHLNCSSVVTMRMFCDYSRCTGLNNDLILTLPKGHYVHQI